MGSDHPTCDSSKKSLAASHHSCLLTPTLLDPRSDHTQEPDIGRTALCSTNKVIGIMLPVSVSANPQKGRTQRMPATTITRSKLRTTSAVKVRSTVSITSISQAAFLRSTHSRNTAQHHQHQPDRSPDKPNGKEACRHPRHRSTDVSPSSVQTKLLPAPARSSP